MKNIAILGGTFNPIHNAHLQMAKTVYATQKYDEILFIPTGIPPHKSRFSDIIADNFHRLKMCELAIIDFPEYKISTIEIFSDQTNYTIDTINELRTQNPNNRYSLIIGADSLMHILRWKDSPQLIQTCQLVVINRPGFDTILDGYIEFLKKEYNADIICVQMEKTPISSTQIRNLISDLLPIEGLVPEKVEKYIQKHNLYEYKHTHNSDLIKLKERLSKRLTEKRYAHSIATMKASSDLAKYHNIDSYKAEVAALLHDCAKCYTDAKKLEMAKRYKMELTSSEKENPDLLHQRLGSIVAMRDYGITDTEILSAIECHTTGKPDMNNLEKLIFISDFIEPTRKAFYGMENIRELAKHSLDMALVAILESTIQYLIDKEKKIDERSLETYRYYIEEKEELKWLKNQLKF